MASCVQSLKVTGSGTSVTSAAFGSDTTAGNFLGVAVGAFAGSNTTASASDNNSSTFNTRATSPASANDVKCIISAAENITGRSGHTVTGASSSSADICVVAAEYSGIQTSSAFDVSAVNGVSGSATVPTGTTGTLAQSDELVIGAVYSFTSSGDLSTPTTTTSGAVGTSATNRQEQDRGAGETLCMADKESTSTAGQSITFTWAASEDSFSCVATFKLAPSFTLEQLAARYRNDDGSETTATWAASQDANVTHPLNTNLRYRALIQSTGDPPSAAYTLRYEKNATGGYVAVPTAQPSVSASVLDANASTSNASTYDTASVTLTAGKLYIIGICHSDTASEQEASGIATVGGAEAFTLIDSQVFDTVATNVHRLSVWRCVPSSTVTAAVRITLNDAGTGCAWQLVELTDAIVTGTDGSDAIGTPVKQGVDANTASTATPGALANSRSIQLAFGAHDLNNTSDVASGTNWNSVGTGVAYATPNTTLEFATNTSGTAQAVTFSTAGSADRACIAFEVKAVTHPVIMSASSNITGGGEATTSQLSGGSGSFTTGRMWDDENGTDTTDIGSANQTEFEWCVQAVSPAVNTDVIRLRVYRGTAAIDTYTVTPQWTVGTPAGNVTVTPTTATLSLSTFAPTVLAPRLVTPTTLALTTTAFAPTVSTPVVCTPTTASLTTTGFAPTVVNPKSATPTTAALTLTTFALTVSTPVTVTPTTAALTLSPFAPTVSTPTTATPSTLSLVLTTFSPTVSTPQTVTPTTTALTITTFAPSVATPVVCTPTTLALTLSTFAPTIVNPKSATPTTLALTLTTFAPTVTASASGTFTPATASLVLTTFAPTVLTPRTATPSTTALTISPFAPTVLAPRTVTPDTLALTITAFAPTVQTPVLATPTTATLTLSAFAPTVSSGGTPSGQLLMLRRRAVAL